MNFRKSKVSLDKLDNLAENDRGGVGGRHNQNPYITLQQATFHKSLHQHKFLSLARICKTSYVIQHNTFRNEDTEH